MQIEILPFKLNFRLNHLAAYNKKQLLNFIKIIWQILFG